jgi:hypothetical protein
LGTQLTNVLVNVTWMVVTVLNVSTAVNVTSTLPASAGVAVTMSSVSESCVTFMNEGMSVTFSERQKSNDSVAG